MNGNNQFAGEPFDGRLAPAAPAPRPIHEFDIPAAYQGEHKIAKIGVVELSPDEELRAARRTGGDQVVLAFELAKEALYEVNDVRVSLANGSTDVAMKQMTPQARALLVTAYAEVNTP